MRPTLRAVSFSGSITGKTERRLSTCANSPFSGERWRTTQTAAAIRGGNEAKSSVNVTTPPADAPITMISLLIRSELTAERPILYRPESLRLLESMGRLDHRSNREELLPHFVDASAHPGSFGALCPVHLFQKILVGIPHLFQQQRGRPQSPLQLRFLGIEQTG